MRRRVPGQADMWAMLAWISAPLGAPYSDAEDERILFLRDVRRWTWRRIAADLGRASQAGVRKRYLILARVYAFDYAPSARPFSTHEDAELLRMREHLGHSWQHIADQLGRPSGACVRMRYGKIKDREAAQRKTTRRRCMDCSVWINSTGPGHRRCDRCRERAASTPWDA